MLSLTYNQTSDWSSGAIVLIRDRRRRARPAPPRRERAPEPLGGPGARAGAATRSGSLLARSGAGDRAGRRTAGPGTVWGTKSRDRGNEKRRARLRDFAGFRARPRGLDQESGRRSERPPIRAAPPRADPRDAAARAA